MVVTVRANRVGMIQGLDAVVGRERGSAVMALNSWRQCLWALRDGSMLKILANVEDAIVHGGQISERWDKGKKEFIEIQKPAIVDLYNKRGK